MDLRSVIVTHLQQNHGKIPKNLWNEHIFSSFEYQFYLFKY